MSPKQNPTPSWHKENEYTTGAGTKRVGKQTSSEDENFLEISPLATLEAQVAPRSKWQGVKFWCDGSRRLLLRSRHTPNPPLHSSGCCALRTVEIHLRLAIRTPVRDRTAVFVAWNHWRCISPHYWGSFPKQDTATTATATTTAEDIAALEAGTQ